ncbi:MAG: hypothetical protein HN846_03475 [Candidatus Pacebacteria bacterium]|jgi:ribonuclease P protein component|nr:hypothetical protein [Candidatus Paceibacterota bacterium]MBT3512122.1 hypothetical protein [Candidatus Paceibacterota bacterium]MBT4005416.1 hypothetical protein [Candidatus Paceibacterota bacterium]MBT4359125.1 hypothetical protein [Candidatus Paceibacterota bacterium]MBT4680958.1 hypothetical protein [Candidatus Paceibacterota bacterium]
MIPKIYKLRLRKISGYFSSCKRYFSKYFLVFYRRHDGNNTKVVVVVPKKIIKLRVNRTQMKRQIYSLCLPLLRKSKGLELVFVINKSITTASREEIFENINNIFSKLDK